MKNLLLASLLFAFSSIVCHAQDTAAIRLALGEKGYKDYMDWVALGVGGLPHTLEGYRTVKELGKQMKDPFDVKLVRDTIKIQSVIFTNPVT